MKSKAAYIYSIVLIIGIILLINILASEFFVRLDMTEDNRYTLSEATEQIIGDLQEPVTITAYFSENIPQKLQNTKQDFKDLLIEYSQRSDGMVNYQFINPGKDEQTEMKVVRREGIRPIVVNVREKDQMKQQKVYMGAVIKKGDQKEVIPFVQPGTAMEYSISSNIKKLVTTHKPFIGFMQGHGEPSLNKMQAVRKSLSVLYKPEPFELSDTANVLSKYNTIAIVAPKDSFPESHLDQLDDFIAGGGNILIALNRVKGDFRRASGSVLATGLEDWLKDKGLRVKPEFIVDANCGMVSVRQQQGGFSFNTQINFPYLPVISNFQEHPITKGLESVSMQFASPIEFVGDSSLSYTPLAKTSKKTGVQNPPLRFNIQKSWSESDFPQSKLTVGAVLEGKFNAGQKSRLVVFGDGDFAATSREQGNKDNVSFMVNSIDWLSDESGLMELRTKGITSRPLEQIKDNKKVFLKYLNFLLPVLIIIVFGIFRFQHKRILRIKRMEAEYV
jgi:gliding-associated putative ABC transporter substrate-binding component GldG